MAEFPNRITWISLGNQVQVRGRHHAAGSTGSRCGRPTPTRRTGQASSFRHPGQSGLDLGSWTRKHRRELMTAILTLVRAWFAAGAPRPARGVSFGSFEIWERIVGGIVEAAGLTGFLDNLKVWRSESDFDTQYWAGHLGWLSEQVRRPRRSARPRSGPRRWPTRPLHGPAQAGRPGGQGRTARRSGEAYSRTPRPPVRRLCWTGRARPRPRERCGTSSPTTSSDLPPAPGPITPTPDPEPAP